MKDLEHDVLFAEMFAIPGIFQPVVNKGLFWIGDPPSGDAINPLIDPRF
jgi:hypothetical protein